MTQVRKDEAAALERFIATNLDGKFQKCIRFTTSDMLPPAPEKMTKHPGLVRLLDILEFDNGGAETVFMNILQADRILLSETREFKHLLYSDAAHSVPRPGVTSVLLKDGYQIQPRQKGALSSAGPLF